MKNIFLSILAGLIFTNGILSLEPPDDTPEPQFDSFIETKLYLTGIWRVNNNIFYARYYWIPSELRAVCNGKTIAECKKLTKDQKVKPDPKLIMPNEIIEITYKIYPQGSWNHSKDYQIPFQIMSKKIDHGLFKKLRLKMQDIIPEAQYKEVSDLHVKDNLDLSPDLQFDKYTREGEKLLFLEIPLNKKFLMGAMVAKLVRNYPGYGKQIYYHLMRLNE